MARTSSGEESRTRDQVVRGRFERNGSATSPSEESLEDHEGDGGLSHITLSTPSGELQMLLDRLDDSEDRSTAFQAVLVAITQSLNEAISSEYDAAEAAISLAQREKLQAMIEELRKVATLLHESLDEKGRRLRDCSQKSSDRLSPFRPADNSESAWWFSLTESVEAVRGSADRIESMMQSQPKDAPVRQLGRIVERLLRRHYRQLLFEAERWMAS